MPGYEAMHCVFLNEENGIIRPVNKLGQKFPITVEKTGNDLEIKGYEDGKILLSDFLIIVPKQIKLNKDEYKKLLNMQ